MLWLLCDEANKTSFLFRESDACVLLLLFLFLPTERVVVRHSAHLNIFFSFVSFRERKIKRVSHCVCVCVKSRFCYFYFLFLFSFNKAMLLCLYFTGLKRGPFFYDVPPPPLCFSFWICALFLLLLLLYIFSCWLARLADGLIYLLIDYTTASQCSIFVSCPPSLSETRGPTTSLAKPNGEGGI